jgi:tetratricopeptide (TPR) repeat protein
MLGHVDRQKGNAERAYKRYQKALEVQANHVAALKGVAAILEEREDWSNLLNVYNNIIYHATLPRDVTDAYLTKGRILDEKLERPDKAVPHYERSLEFEHRQPGVWLRLAEIAIRRAQWDQAVRYAAQGLEVAGDEPAIAADLHLVAATAHAVQGDTSSAETSWAAAQAASSAVAEAAIAAAGGHAPLEDIPATIAALRSRLPR